MNTIKTLIATAAMTLATLASAQFRPDPQQADMVLDNAQRQQVIDKVIGELRDNYVFPDQAKKMEASLRQKQKKGAYDGIVSAKKLSTTMNDDLRAINNDKHLNLIYSERVLPPEEMDRTPSPEEQAADLADMKATNFGVERIERMPFNIGYLGLQQFASAREAAPTLAATMQVLANTQALIIDLRKNGGGDPATVTMLASYLLDERTHMTDIFERKGDRHIQMWSTDAVQGERFGQKKDVYILTSHDTFSAAEDFSYALKNLKRATIIGETTGGGAHPGAFMRINDHFTFFVPSGRSTSPITKTNWEGVGVTPHIAVPAADALKTAQLEILKKMAAVEKDQARLARINTRIEKVGAESAAL